MIFTIYLISFSVFIVYNSWNTSWLVYTSYIKILKKSVWFLSNLTNISFRKSYLFSLKIFVFWPIFVIILLPWSEAVVNIGQT